EWFHSWQMQAHLLGMVRMNQTSLLTTRRSFLKTVSAAGVGLTLARAGSAQDATAPSHKIKLGIDNFAVRAMNCKAPALIDYAVALKTDSLFITDLDAFDRHDDQYLGELRAKAADQNLQIYVGTWSICPTSKSFKDKWGTAGEHLALGIRVAKALGS